MKYVRAGTCLLPVVATFFAIFLPIKFSPEGTRTMIYKNLEGEVTSEYTEDLGSVGNKVSMTFFLILIFNAIALFVKFFIDHFVEDVFFTEPQHSDYY